jgi:glycosyltransferase involved in cell wall biosynthesis
MAVRDGAPWVAEAVASVLGQTAGDLELIVIDDGSTDATPELLARVRDARLRVDRRAAAGLTPSLNRGLALARAPLVARLDADDLALPDRLARQGAFLAAHPEVGLLGGGVRELDADGREVGGAGAADPGRRAPRRAHPPESLRALGGDGPARAGGAGGRL